MATGTFTVTDTYTDDGYRIALDASGAAYKITGVNVDGTYDLQPLSYGVATGTANKNALIYILMAVAFFYLTKE